MMIIDFLCENWLIILISILVLTYIIYLSVNKRWTKVREFAYRVMLLAERTFSDDDGQMKFDFVVRIVYKSMPSWMQLFISQENIKRFIKTWYEIAKDFLDDGEINSSFK
jgi:hypothetical protein